ncbi:MAG: hypothetical protein MUF04_03850 [Akkermansiaceae bacterium]|jgi:hypothetical protein|nr:hypothetical protein [Akkermansiaceae bacterium]
MNFDQGEFNFDAKGTEEGFRRWRDDLDEKKRAFESRWGVVLGRRVRVQLRDHLKPLVGTLELVSAPRSTRDAPPRFRMRGIEFGLAEIESVVQNGGE